MTEYSLRARAAPTTRTPLTAVLIAALVGALLGGCGPSDGPDKADGPGKAGAAGPASAAGAPGGANAQPAAPRPPEVGVVTAERTQVPLVRELPGRLQATRTAEVRARVEGIVLERAYDEGSDVRAGRVLFRLDPAPYRANVESAQAELARARADLAQAKLTVSRYRPLLPERAVSQQEFDQALTVQKQAEAAVAAAQAALTRAKLELGYTTIDAPIAGRAGRALVTEGALVGGGEATHVTTVEQIDPIYAYFTQSSGELLRLRQAFAAGTLAPTEDTQVRLILEDGTEYPETGKLNFSDLASDPGTGAVTLRAEFPNPGRMLLPGMFVRVQLQQAVNRDAVLVPIRAVSMSPKGHMVMTVGPGNKVVPRQIRTARMEGSDWVVEGGLEGGERVIVEGLQKARPGTVVRPVAARPRAEPVAPAPEQAASRAPAGKAAARERG